MSMNANRYRNHDVTADPRDRSRRPDARAYTMTRRGQRRAKSALLFLAWAFPAELAF